MKKNKSKLQLLLLLFLIIIFPLLILNIQKIQQILSRAFGIPANIEIDIADEMETIIPFWQNFAQGGESSNDMIYPIINEIKAISPQNIRIDHIYDHFNLVSKNNGQISLNFKELDQMVNSILKTNALPFFSLSYMPKSLVKNGDITNKPDNWNDWAYVVQKTIEHYSGKNEYNLNNVYYEVWNEPDLFGKWKTYGDKNYLTLYHFAANGAQNALNTNKFYLGGPATTAPYKNWIEELSTYVEKNNLRLDFISWHRYHINPQQFFDDLKNINQWTFDYPRVLGIPKILSEWGFDSENNNNYDNNFAAAHTISAVRKMISGYKYVFAFELVDGKNPQNQEFWGRWGLITHPDFGKKLKPRYQAFQFLNKIYGTRLFVKGEGTYVSAIATKDNEDIKLLLVNFDPENKNSENVPIKITNLNPGTYILKNQRLGQKETTVTVEINETGFSQNMVMLSNSIIFMQLSPVNAYSDL